MHLVLAISQITAPEKLLSEWGFCVKKNRAKRALLGVIGSTIEHYIEAAPAIGHVAIREISTRQHGFVVKLWIVAPKPTNNPFHNLTLLLEK